MKRAHEPKAVEQPQPEGEAPPSFGEHRQQVVERRQTDRSGDRDLYPLRLRVDDVECRQPQRDRVSQGEAGDDLQHFEQRGPQPLDRLPLAGAPAQDGREQQRKEKAQMVGAARDVADSLDEGFPGLLAGRHFGEGDRPGALLGRKAEPTLARSGEADQAAVLGVDVEQQRVGEADLAHRCGASERKIEHCVDAVRVAGQPQRGGVLRAVVAGLREREVTLRVGDQLGLARLHFPPHNPSVSVGVEIQLTVEILEGDVPPRGQLSVGRGEGQVAVARLVRKGGGGEQRHREPHSPRERTRNSIVRDPNGLDVRTRRPGAHRFNASSFATNSLSGGH